MAFWTDCQGTYTRPDGEEYVGEFRDGKPNGQGTHTYSDGAKYIGEWRNGNFNGRGSLAYTHWGEYVGEFRDSKPNGEEPIRIPMGENQVSGVTAASTAKELSRIPAGKRSRRIP